jgi:hypothetical protein
MEQRRAFPDFEGIVRPHVFTMGALGSRGDLHCEMDINRSACTFGG